MTIDATRFQRLLAEFKLERLFNELGWDRTALAPQTLQINGESFQLSTIAQKRGVAVFLCSPEATGQIPPRAVQLKIEHEAHRLAHEHLLIFADAAQTALTWLWVSRAPGQPTVTRTHTWHQGSSGEALRQKLESIVWSLEAEEAITLTDVITGLQRAFDRDRLSKRFYEKFKTEHLAFSEFITGLNTATKTVWYASLMLNRLMFIYFIQRKGFLDGNPNYLSDRLQAVRERTGSGQFHSFYRLFLRRLFHEGLGTPKDARSADFVRLVGRIPYLNGGLFDLHTLEETHPDIDIPDEAFERLFTFFDAYDWHLDDRPLATGNEINPDVLGYIFEKYINQKQMGAYYTKEDITEYISKNTVIPHVLEQARQRCKVAFEGQTSVWHWLHVDPERYLYPAMKTGVIEATGEIIPESALPDFVQTGMHDPQARMFDKRYNLGEAVWYTASGERGTLPTETWREYVERRRRCLELRDRLIGGTVRDVDELITLNLDIRQFMQDVIDRCTDAQLLRAVWQAIVGRVPERSNERFRHGITILDPTCGSGAFLFAALNVLKPLYEACLERMAGFIEDAAKLGRPPEADFVKVLDEVNRHPSPSYFVYKSIILNNLYGVDIMAEAVEICKLRLFLKLVSQVNHERELEPLPDMDFNIRTGNTLVGYATEGQFDAAVDLASDHAHRAEIKARTADLADLFDRFREQQTQRGGQVTAQDKRALRERLGSLSLELDRYLARDYGIDPENAQAFKQWRDSHQPFHWFAEFYGVIRNGGFSVVIGNPPYVVNSAKKVPYDLLRAGLITINCKNLYAFVFERSISIAKSESPVSLIVQLTAISSANMQSLQDILLDRGMLVVLPYPRRPESIFDGVEMPVVILSSYANLKKMIVSSRVGRMYGEERSICLDVHTTTTHNIRLHNHRIGKLHCGIEKSIIAKITSTSQSTRNLVARSSSDLVFYQEACRYWLKAQTGLPFFARNGQEIQPPHGRIFTVTNTKAADFFACLLNSSFFYWYYSLFSDCEHVNDDLVKSVPIPNHWNNQDWSNLYKNLSFSLESHAIRKTIRTSQGHVIEYNQMKAAYSKKEIDFIDIALSNIYGFSDEETDFIINYDIKYRMGGTNNNDEE